MRPADRPPRICIVDDDDAIRDSLRLLLESYRYAIADFGSPIALLDASAAWSFDCLVLDLHLPGMSGLELIEVLRSRRIPTPAILLTGDFDPSLEGRVRNVGNLTVLGKPVRLDALLDAVERSLSSCP